MIRLKAAYALPLAPVAPQTLQAAQLPCWRVGATLQAAGFTRCSYGWFGHGLLLPKDDAEAFKHLRIEARRRAHITKRPDSSHWREWLIRHDFAK